MSSRWISISFRPPAVARRGSALIAACDGLDQRRFAHAARAPQQRIVGRQAAGEALGVLDQHVAHPVDALEQRHLDAVDPRRPGCSRCPSGCQTKASAAAKSGARRRRAAPAARARRRCAAACRRGSRRSKDGAVSDIPAGPPCVVRAPLAGRSGVPQAGCRHGQVAGMPATCRQRCNWDARRL